MSAAKLHITRLGRASSGVAGLDHILHGGFPEKHLYLVDGDPGTGKTTLAMHFLMEGVRNHERVLYVSLSETENELRGVAASHGWNLEGIEIFELSPSAEELGVDGQYTVFHPSEVELAQTTQSILERVTATNPARVVIDSLSELRMLAKDALRYRREILWLKQFFSQQQCTVLLLDDHALGHNDLQLQSLAHGVVLMENLSREYGSKRRRLEVRKLRGSSFHDGYHDYQIVTGGLKVFPRLKVPMLSGSDEGTLLPSGVREIDNMAGGGVWRGSSTLISGPAGVGKSSLATRFALSAAQRGERVAMYMFEESLHTLRRRSKGLGMDLTHSLNEGMIRVEQVDPAELSPGEFAHMVRAQVEAKNVSMVIIDSLNGYLNSMPGEDYLPIHMHELLAFLNFKGVATFLVLAQHGVIGTTMTTPVDVSYLADTVFLLRFFEARGEVRQAISVLKHRSGSHEKTIREFKLLPGGIKVGQPLSAFRGVLSGIPEYVGGEELLERPSAGGGNGDHP